MIVDPRRLVDVGMRTPAAIRLSATWARQAGGWRRAVAGPTNVLVSVRQRFGGLTVIVTATEASG